MISPNDEFAHVNPLRDKNQSSRGLSKKQSSAKLEKSRSRSPVKERSTKPPSRSKSGSNAGQTSPPNYPPPPLPPHISDGNEEKEYTMDSVYGGEEVGIELERVDSRYNAPNKSPRKPPKKPTRAKSGHPAGAGLDRRDSPAASPVAPGYDAEEQPLMRSKSPQRTQNPAAVAGSNGSTKAGTNAAGAAGGGGAAAAGGGGSKNTAAKSSQSKEPDIFKGVNGLQYGLWAHYMAYGAAAMCMCMGIFAILWDDAPDFDCKIDGDEISDKYLFDNNDNCPTIYKSDGEEKDICCDPDDAESDITGNVPIGVVYVLYSLFIAIYENADWGFGLWFPNNHMLFRWRVSLIGAVHCVMALVGLTNYATSLAGACLLTTGVCYIWAAHRCEAGDGGRAKRKKDRAAAKAKRNEDNESRTVSEAVMTNVKYVLSFNPVTFCTRIYNEDKLSSYVWVALYLILNLVLFAYTLDAWYAAVYKMEDDIINGKIDVDCDSLECHVNRKAVRYGPLSRWAPWAKAFGGLLNLNCSLLLLPVIRMLLRKLNNYGESFAAAQHNNDLLGKLCARPLTRYIPLQKNIEFHQLCAIMIFICAWGHMVFHWINLYYANNVTIRRFRTWGWGGTDFFTGALITYSMFVIYTAAPQAVRMAKYEVFFKSHHMFIVFYLMLFIHGPVFFYWATIPVLLYMLERYMQSRRGNRPYLLVKVEWISPVMAIYFRPQFKEDFQFKEGQYLYVNCPHISTTEWHPFTISSAVDDLHFGPRIHLETGEEVIEVPRPKSLPAKARWNKYCLVSQNWKDMQEWEYLDKSETGYNDFVSIHVKVHGLEEPVARTWTRKLKEYFEMMSPAQQFPFYFTQRDSRGDLTVGKRYGPDGKQILRIDGPHSAPSEHYTNYGTVMLIGAGIGLTPCASILCALTKYRWRKNFNPELLHFYWVVRQNELDSFQWLIHMLTELSFELKKGKATNQIERRYYSEINIYVTGVSKKPMDVKPLYRPKRQFTEAAAGSTVTPTFTADQLYAKVLNPTVSSKGQIETMKRQHLESGGGQMGENRLQDIWIWNGRPNWDEVFHEMKDQRQHKDIGVCFCGAPVIGADLRSMCEKYSNAKEQCLFSLHKENF